MKINNQCKIIEDLLPSYVEKLTNEETNQFIEEHFINCDSCKEKIKNMSSKLEIDEIDEKELNYLKKYNRNRKNAILLGILLGILIIIIAYFCVVFYRFHILHTLNKQFENYTISNNMYIEVMTNDLNNNSLVNNTSKYWYKDGILKIEEYYNNEKLDLVTIIDFNNNVKYNISEKNKSISVKKDNNFLQTVSQEILKSIIGTNYIRDLRNQIVYAFDFCSVNIYQYKKLYREQFYICDFGNEQYIYNKDTNLIQCRIQYLGNRIELQKYDYNFNCVTEEDISLIKFEDYTRITE